jgi:hypothetical protein
MYIPLFPFNPPFFKCLDAFWVQGPLISPKGPLAYKQVFLPLIFGGIRLIPTSTITLVAYLRSWAFIPSIIVTRFMVNQCPFLLEALMWIDNNTFHLQQHLNATCDFLPPLTQAYMSPSFWRTHWKPNGSSSRFHFGTFAPSYPF